MIIIILKDILKIARFLIQSFFFANSRQLTAISKRNPGNLV